MEWPPIHKHLNREMKSMSMKATRRDFLKIGAATGVGYWVSAGNQRIARADANSRLGVVGIGVGGKGQSDIKNASQFGDVVGICDVDHGTRAAQENNYKCKGYADYREMLTDLQDKFEIAVISTPDHMHAPATLMAMRMKKHCYTQKPLTRTIYEARLITEIAKENGVCSQMGNQGSALNTSRMSIAQLKSGVLGPLEAVYVWCNRPVWPQKPGRVTTMEKFIQNMKDEEFDQEDIDEEVENKKKEIADSLKNLDWDLWLGVAPDRPFWPGIYHSFNWRSWWDFGTGALGDMACHQVTVPFDGCELKDPTSVVAKTSGHDFDSFPEESYIHFEFPATENRPAIPFYWYDRNGNKPPKAAFEAAGYKGDIPSSGALVIGEKGCFYSPDDYCGSFKLYNKDGSDMEPAKVEGVEFAVDKGGFDVNNMYELFRAVEENNPKICRSNFVDRGGPLTETILLGNLAVWAAAKGGEGEKIEWDAKNLKITNLANLKTPGVADLVKPKYRGDYKLD